MMKVPKVAMIALVSMTIDVVAFTIHPAARSTSSAAATASSSSLLQAAKVGIYYDSSTGNTETCAGYLGTAAQLSPEYIGDTSEDDILSQDCLIVGAPTWHTDSEVERSGTNWDQWLYEALPNLDLKDKKVAIFGCGDQESYSDYFCDAAGELYDCFVKAGCQVYGKTSTDGYNHQASKAIVDDNDGSSFCGLMFDEDNQYDLSEDRAKKWIAQLKTEGFFENCLKI